MTKAPYRRKLSILIANGTLEPTGREEIIEAIKIYADRGDERARKVLALLGLIEESPEAESSEEEDQPDYRGPAVLG